MDPFRDVERRLGHRQQVEPVDVSLVWRSRVTGRFGRVRTETARIAAVIVELSVSGAGVVAPAVDGLGVGSSVRLERVGYGAAAVVRRVVPREDSRLWYGVHFTTLDSQMRQFLFRLISTGRPGEIDWLDSR